MSRFLRLALSAGIPYGLFMGLFWLLFAHWPIAVVAVAAVVVGTLFGTLFSAGMIAFAHSAAVKRSATPVFAPGEQIVREGGANHLRGLEAVGGRLFLTDRRLVFKSHRFNFQRHELSLPLDHIVEARSRMTCWVFRTGLEVQTTDGHGERFVVEARDEWVQAIMTARRQPESQE